MAEKVEPVPHGYQSVTPYLIVTDGEAALAFYTAAFGAAESMRISSPDGKIGHAEFRVAGSTVMLAEEYPDMDCYSPLKYGGTPVSLALYVPNVDELVAQAVKAGAELVRPVEDKFYGDRMGSLKDPFGHIWHVATHIEDVSPEEMQKRAAALYGE